MLKWKKRHCKKRTLKILLGELKDNIQYAYYGILPYDYRPHQLWYRLKCLIWNRYTTIKPRTLPHTWVDKTDLLPHCMFEILCRFIENECSPGHIEWYGEHGHKIVPGNPWKPQSCRHPNAVYVRDEMQYLYDWWNKYLAEIEHTHDKWHEHIKDKPIGYNEDVPLYHDDENEPYAYEWIGMNQDETDKALWKEAEEEEKKWNSELQSNMVRIVYLRPFLWT